MKRFLVPGSSGFTDDRELNPWMAAAADTSFPRTFNSTVPPFTAQQIDSEVHPGASFSVSETAMENGWENVGNFLERCFLCKKMLNQKHEVYMYGIFQAFCTPECRDKQIDIDRKMKKDCKKSGGTSAESSRKSKNQSGSRHPGKHAAVQFHI